MRGRVGRKMKSIMGELGVVAFIYTTNYAVGGSLMFVLRSRARRLLMSCRINFFMIGWKWNEVGSTRLVVILSTLRWCRQGHGIIETVNSPVEAHTLEIMTINLVRGRSAMVDHTADIRRWFKDSILILSSQQAMKSIEIRAFVLGRVIYWKWNRFHRILDCCLYVSCCW